MKLLFVGTNEFAIKLPLPRKVSEGTRVTAQQVTDGISWWMAINHKQYTPPIITDDLYYYTYPRALVDMALLASVPPFEFFLSSEQDSYDCDDVARWRHTIIRMFLKSSAVFSITGRAPGMIPHRFIGIMTSDQGLIWHDDRPQTNPEGNWTTYDNIRF